MSTFRNILVLCEGNHCRSPMAEGMLRAATNGRAHVESCGISALVGQPAHEEALKLMAEHGIDIAAHLGRQLTSDLALGADLILVMDQAQKGRCERLVPSARGRIFLLGHWLPAADQEIPDPIGRDARVHRMVHDHIQKAVATWLPRLDISLRRNP